MLFYDNFSFLAKLIVLFHNVFIEPDSYPCIRVQVSSFPFIQQSYYNVHSSPHEAKNGTLGLI